MKFMMRLSALFLVMLLLSGIANAEPNREQLNRMVEQLQKSPGDNALREQIIRLAQELRPAPEVPDDAIKYEGRGQFRFKTAKNVQDYFAAAQEYEQAVKSAPWVDGYYADLCTIYEKAEKYADAKRNCMFALHATGNPQLMTDLKRRIAGLEVGIEKENSPEEQSKREIERQRRETFAAQENFPALIRKLEGATFVRVGFESTETYENTVVSGYEISFVRKPFDENGVPMLDMPTYLYCQLSSLQPSRRIYSYAVGVEPNSNSDFNPQESMLYGRFSLSQDQQTLTERIHDLATQLDKIHIYVRKQ